MESEVNPNTDICHAVRIDGPPKSGNIGHNPKWPEEPRQSIHFTRPGRYWSGLTNEPKPSGPVKKQKKFPFRSLNKQFIAYRNVDCGPEAAKAVKAFTPYVSLLSNSLNVADSWTNLSNEKSNSMNTDYEMESCQNQSKFSAIKVKSLERQNTNLSKRFVNSIREPFKNIRQGKFINRYKNKQFSSMLQTPNKEHTLTSDQKYSQSLKKEKLPLNSDISIVISSDEEEVILIPTQQAVPINIDSSSDESQNVGINSNSTLKQNASQIPCTKTSDNASRCTSPASVMSDDFIEQNDRSRLLKESEMADDEDLILIQKTVDEYQENYTTKQTKAGKSLAEPKVQQNKEIDFTVTQTNFEGLDVYERGTDMLESSVYSKGCKKPCKKRKLSEQCIAKTYPMDMSSDSENDFLCNLAIEADKSGDNGPTLSSPLSNRENSSLTQSKDLTDNDFITLINTITEDNPNDDNDNVDENNITAREIAENVLNNSGNRSIEEPQEEYNHQFVNDEGEVPFPHRLYAELNEIFAKIDEMDKLPKKKTPETQKTPETPAQCTESTPPAKPKIPETEDKSDGTLYHVFDYRTKNEKNVSEIAWNEEMYRFYNQSWKGENFNVNEMLSKMDPKANWKVIPADRFLKQKRNVDKKCFNCCEYGHTKANCVQPKKPPVCYMCGNKGHVELRCPNKICLKCGKKSNSFKRNCNSCNHLNSRMCLLCKLRGHSIETCPDKWRRYHSTSNMFAQRLNDNFEWNDRMYCCICAQKGHISDSCPYAPRYLDYPPVLSRVMSHVPSYDILLSSDNKHRSEYNLHCDPREPFQFKFPNNLVKNNWYGRFVQAVGLENEINWKQDECTNERDSNAIIKKRKMSHEANECSTSSKRNPISLIQSNCTKNLNDNGNIYSCESNPENFKIPDNMATEKKRNHDDLTELFVADSDSNYSFSDHFGSSEDHLVQIPLEPEMGSLLDYIPLSNSYNTKSYFNEMNEEQNKEVQSTYDGEQIKKSDKINEQQIGEGRIQNKFVYEDDSENDMPRNEEIPDRPSEAKIFLTDLHIKFLLSPDGNKFLEENSAKYNLKTSIEWTPHGHTLILYGLSINQDNFRLDLVSQFKNLNDKIRQENFDKIQNFPKKTEALVRFLREQLKQLDLYLGNPNHHLKRLKLYESRSTKASYKLSEKIRRILNMILFGQAGLGNGKIYLQHIQNNFRKLLDCTNEFVPPKLRDEIKIHWQYIFSCYQKENYDDLVIMYNQLKAKNELSKVIIDPLLLGKKKCLNEQKDQLEMNNKMAPANTKNINVPKSATDNNNIKNPKETINRKHQLNVVINPVAVYKKKLLKLSEVSTLNNAPAKSSIPSKSENLPKTNTGLGSGEKQSTSLNFLKRKRSENPKQTNMFWSKESIKFLDEFWSSHSNPTLLEKFIRVRDKAVNGLLSYNDYRAIIKITTHLKKIKKHI